MVDVYNKISERLQSVNHVVTAFRQYLDTNDKSLIKNLPNDILEKTLNLHASTKGDRESGWYKAIERELSRRKRSKDHWIGFAKGVIVTVIGGLILWFIISRLIGE